MLTCPSNTGASKLVFATAEPQQGDTVEQLLAKQLVGRKAAPLDTVQVTVAGGAAWAPVIVPRAGRNAVLITAAVANTLPVYWVTGPGSTFGGATNTGHQLMPGGAINLNRLQDGDLDNLYIWVSQVSGSGTIAITDR